MSMPVRLAFMHSPSPARPTPAGTDSHPSNAILGPARPKREVLLRNRSRDAQNGTTPAFPSVPLWLRAGRNRSIGARRAGAAPSVRGSLWGRWVARGRRKRRDASETVADLVAPKAFQAREGPVEP